MISQLASNWVEAGRSLGFETVSPYEFVLPNGETIVADVLVRHFGGHEGTLVVRDIAQMKQAETEMLNAGFGYSVMSEERREQALDLAGYIEILSDWGWYGDPDDAPTWLPPVTSEPVD